MESGVKLFTNFLPPSLQFLTKGWARSRQGPRPLAAGVWSTKRPRSVGSGEGGCHQPKPIGVLAAQLAADPTYTVTSTQAPNPPPAPSSCAWEGSGAEEGVTLWM